MTDRVWVATSAAPEQNRRDRCGGARRSKPQKGLGSRSVSDGYFSMLGNANCVAADGTVDGLSGCYGRKSKCRAVAALGFGMIERRICLGE
jgi:hypothetical protein